MAKIEYVIASMEGQSGRFKVCLKVQESVLGHRFFDENQANPQFLLRFRQRSYEFFYETGLH